MTHSGVDRELAAGAAIGDLEPAEAGAWAAHRDGCTDCRDLEGDLALVLVDLALTVPERIPPPDLLAAVRRAIVEDARRGAAPSAEAVNATGAPTIPTPFPSRIERVARAGRSDRARWAPPPTLAAAGLRGARVFMGLAAALALAAAGLGWRAVALQGELDISAARALTLESALAAGSGAMTVATDPAHVMVTLHAEPLAPAATATVVFVPGSERAYLVAEHLPATTSDRAYQLWYADAAGVHPLQVVAFDGSGALVVPMAVDLGAAAAVMITLENAAGATGAPGPQVVFGDL